VIRACVLATTLLVAAGCGGEDDGRLEVFAASSLMGPLSLLEGPRYTFAGSDALATQIREGAEVDVFAAASHKAPLELFQAGLVSAPREFATNRLVIVVPRANDARIRSLADLRRNGVRIVIGDDGVPAGDYAREALATAQAEDVLENVVSLEDDVKGVVAKVALGEADAGFAYATDAQAASADLTVVELPRDVRPRVRYLVAAVAESDRHQQAEEFIDRLLSEEGRSALRAAGFRTP
jgi:molybdate transport system substrate-binding protein